MENFNFEAPAEMFSTEFGRGKRMTYRRFPTGAEALQFVIETQDAGRSATSVIQVEDERFDRDEMRALYESADYPLPRRKDAG